MKGTAKVLISVGVLTSFMLLYVHGQINLFNLSYEMDEQSTTLTRKSETYRKLVFEVEQLKAPRLLEARMRDLSLDLTLPSEIQVVRVPSEVVLSAMPQPEIPMSAFSRGWGDLLGHWVKVALAKTDS